MSHKVCALVGAGAGLGLAIAQRFGREGYQLALLARRLEALAEYTKTLNDAGIQATQLDLRLMRLMLPRLRLLLPRSARRSALLMSWFIMLLCSNRTL